MRSNYAISTFCYGERYYAQTNRLIENIMHLEGSPEIYVVTDSPSSILKKDFVKVKHINEYNKKYSEYNKDYYNFDFSVKRFSLLFAFENGHDKVISTDADVMVDHSIYSQEAIMSLFFDNTIAGRLTYNFKDAIENNTQLGKRFLHYEEKYGINFDKKRLDFMPEDCIQFISIQEEKIKYNFLNVWDNCAKIKYSDGLLNTPAGNIDEICFAALMNDIQLINGYSLREELFNIMVPDHDLWYNS